MSVPTKREWLERAETYLGRPLTLGEGIMLLRAWAAANDFDQAMERVKSITESEGS